MEAFFLFIGFITFVLVLVGILRSVFKTSSKLIEDISVNKQGGLYFLALPLITELKSTFGVVKERDNGSVFEVTLIAKDNGLGKPNYIEVKVQLIQNTLFIEYSIFSGYCLSRFDSSQHLYTSPRYHFEHWLYNQDQVGHDLTIRISRQILVMQEAGIRVYIP